MFFTFLNKDEPQYPDISLLIKYTPEEVLFYYYNSIMKIPLPTYWKIKELAELEEDNFSPCRLWSELFDICLNVYHDVSHLKNNEFIITLGPYYYPISNSRFYFTKEIPDHSSILFADEFAGLISLAQTPEAPPELHAYLKTRKNSKKKARNKEELIKDIIMCIMSLKETEKLNKHLNYLNKLLEGRYTIVQQEDIMPVEPDNLPEKPCKPEEEATGNIIPFSVLASRRKKQYELICSDYNHNMKVYLLRYKEFEKACERYKNLLEEWSGLEYDFRERCFEDIEAHEEKLSEIQQRLRIYNSIITRSFVHASYQDTQTLTIFKQYLETGRAEDLQDCMNIYEDECHWSEIKASQERIENTIHFLQSNDEGIRFATQHIEHLLDKKRDDPVKTKESIL